MAVSHRGVGVASLRRWHLITDKERQAALAGRWGKNVPHRGGGLVKGQGVEEVGWGGVG